MVVGVLGLSFVAALVHISTHSQHGSKACSLGVITQDCNKEDAGSNQ